MASTSNLRPNFVNVITTNCVRECTINKPLFLFDENKVFEFIVLRTNFYRSGILRTTSLRIMPLELSRSPLRLERTIMMAKMYITTSCSISLLVLSRKQILVERPIMILDSSTLSRVTMILRLINAPILDSLGDWARLRSNSRMGHMCIQALRYFIASLCIKRNGIKFCSQLLAVLGQYSN